MFLYLWCEFRIAGIVWSLGSGNDSMSEIQECPPWFSYLLIIVFGKRMDCRSSKVGMLRGKLSSSLYSTTLPEVLESLIFSDRDQLSEKESNKMRVAYLF